MMKLWQPSQLVLGVVLAGAVAAGCAHSGSEAQMQPDQPMASSDISGAQTDPSMLGQGASDPSVNTQPATADVQPVQSPPPPLVSADMNSAAPSTMNPAPKGETFPAQSGQQFTIPVSPDPRAVAPSDSAPSSPEMVGPSASLQRIQAFDLGEIPMAKLASQSGGSAVAAYGRKVLRDRRASEAQVNKLAAQLNVHLDQSDEAAQNELKDDQQDLAQLQSLSGAELDQAYARHMIKDRQEAVDMLTALQSTTSEPKVGKLITRLLPVVQREEKEARALPVGNAPSAANP